MRLYKVERSSLSYRFTFNRVLVMLPGPGSPAFSVLSRSLVPHGFSATGVTIETPSQRLSDVSVSISLLNDRVLLKLCYGWIELFTGDLLTEDIESLVAILVAVFAGLQEMDSDTGRGRTRVISTAHLRLSPSDANSFFGDHLGQKTQPALIPDAFAYKIKTGEAVTGVEEILDSRIVIARSALYSNALFVEFSIEYTGSSNPSVAAEVVRNAYYRALEWLELREENE